MSTAPVLDLADLPQYAHLIGDAEPARRRGWRIPAIVCLVLALLLGAATLAGSMPALSWFGDGRAEQTRLALAELPDIASLNVDDKAQIKAEGLVAQQQNDAIPVLGQPVEVAAEFRLLASQPETYDTALRCLTQAVYYEAAVEPLQGRRGVAQVVLNRVRHPAYPNSVCGVVYQGSERRTGCQFSFTCDGSLLRGPMAGPWREAHEVARAALAGYVERSVGTATHYHADYVLPYWAYSLGKIGKLGRHIFYRFNGGAGSVRSFTARYAGLEHIPALNTALLETRLAEAEEDVLLPVEQVVPGLTVTPHVTDRHAENDVGGRLDTTKEWRLTIPDPVQASSRYRQAIGEPVDPVSTASPAGVLAGEDPAVAAKVADASQTGVAKPK
jgi:spore germination cell wall hydrolase CwlJ-like protein